MQGLPRHFFREARVLAEAGIHAWADLAPVEDSGLRQLAQRSLASEARLRRLRAQARLIVGLDLPAEAAALLLHGGIPDVASLAVADPDDLLRRLQRLERSLLQGQSRLQLLDLQGWILRARRQTGRSRN
jgi:hypothetical protein